MDLFARVARRDNLVVDELIAPASSGVQLGRRVPFRGLVVDAPTAEAQPDLAKVAGAAGLPLMVDPLTPLFQDLQATNDSWAQLPFAQSDKMEPQDLGSGAVQDELIDRVVTYQIDRGASLIVPPYFYATDPKDPWFHVQLSVNRRTAAFLDSENVTLPVAPILAANLRTFGVRASWPIGIDQFVRSTDKMNVRHIGLALSSSRAHDGDTEDRVSAYLSTVAHLSAAAPVMAWRQGHYGLAAVAAGAIGYQVGPGTDERCDFATLARNRRPRDAEARSFGTPRYIYLPLLGRSLKETAAVALLDNRLLRGSLTCMDPGCCPDGVSSMTDAWRQHALRARGRQLDELGSMPDAAWRLHHIETQAGRAADAARTANQVLASAGIRERVPERSFRSLVTVAGAMRRSSGRRASSA